MSSWLVVWKSTGVRSRERERFLYWGADIAFAYLMNMIFWLIVPTYKINLRVLVTWLCGTREKSGQVSQKFPNNGGGWGVVGGKEKKGESLRQRAAHGQKSSDLSRAIIPNTPIRLTLSMHLRMCVYQPQSTFNILTTNLFTCSIRVLYVVKMFQYGDAWDGNIFFSANGQTESHRKSTVLHFPGSLCVRVYYTFWKIFSQNFLEFAADNMSQTTAALFLLHSLIIIMILLVRADGIP